MSERNSAYRDGVILVDYRLVGINNIKLEFIGALTAKVVKQASKLLGALFKNVHSYSATFSLQSHCRQQSG